jgi:hypothetical protein
MNIPPLSPLRKSGSFSLLRSSFVLLSVSLSLNEMRSIRITQDRGESWKSKLRFILARQDGFFSRMPRPDRSRRADLEWSKSRRLIENADDLPGIELREWDVFFFSFHGWRCERMNDWTPAEGLRWCLFQLLDPVVDTIQSLLHIPGDLHRDNLSAPASIVTIFFLMYINYISFYS